MNIDQVGGDVVMSGSGTANTAGLGTAGGPGNIQTMIDAPYGEAFTGGDMPTSAEYYTGISGPGDFGEGIGSIIYADSASGDFMGVYGLIGRLYLPADYVSQSQLSGTATFEDNTVAGMGLTEGQYVWTWGSGDNADSLTLNITPEPATMAMLALGATALLRRRRR